MILFQLLDDVHPQVFGFCRRIASAGSRRSAPDAALAVSPGPARASLVSARPDHERRRRRARADAARPRANLAARHARRHRHASAHLPAACSADSRAASSASESPRRLARQSKSRPPQPGRRRRRSRPTTACNRRSRPRRPRPIRLCPRPSRRLRTPPAIPPPRDPACRSGCLAGRITRTSATPLPPSRGRSVGQRPGQHHHPGPPPYGRPRSVARPSQNRRIPGRLRGHVPDADGPPARTISGKQRDDVDPHSRSSTAPA